MIKVAAVADLAVLVYSLIGRGPGNCCSSEIRKLAGMRRRLRKKKHIGEYRQYGIFLEASLSNGNTSTLINEFRTQAIEPNGLAFRGRIARQALSGFVDLGRRDDYEANQERIVLWLMHHPLVASVDHPSLVDY